MDPVLIIFQILIILFSVVIHEVSHGVAANSLGDPTAKNLGRLTLNPIKHLDFFGSILLPLLTIFLGGFVFGYAKPVPYNPYLLRDRRYGPAKIAVAGPASNLIIALAFSAFFKIIPAGLENTLLPQLFSQVIFLNLILAIFNLMPVPPLDGHWLLLTFLPARFYAFRKFILQYGLLLFFIFLIFIFPLILPLVFGIFNLLTGQLPIR